MIGVGIVFGLIGILGIWDYYVLRNVQKSHLMYLFITLCIALSLPFFIPFRWTALRFIIAMIVFNKIIKSTEILYKRVYDPKMLETYGLYIFWSSNFPDTFIPKSQDEKREIQKQGLKRLSRCIFKTLAVVFLLFVSYKWPVIHRYYVTHYLWLCFLIYATFTNLGDFLTGGMMLFGIGFIELFNNPFIARSPREFWGKRWNLYFRDVCHRNIFKPMAHLKKPALAAGIVFFVSAVLHEYLVFVCLHMRMIGYMTAFFMLHYIATVVETLVAKKFEYKKIFPLPVAIGMHVGWMVLTIPLLINPLLLIFPVNSWESIISFVRSL